jgi:hypothetical protein
MRQRNWRLVIVGAVLLNFIAPVFFIVMLTMSFKSNDPTAMMQVVGQVAGVVGGIGLVMMIFGLIGKKS